jgi:hypothetical protein
VVNAVDKYKQDKKERESTALNTMLIMLCVKKDADDKISFDLSPDAIEKVKNNLNKKGININSDNEVRFLADIIGLDDEKKGKLIDFIRTSKDIKREDAVELLECIKNYVEKDSF